MDDGKATHHGLTADTALGHAARLLHHAEQDTNLAYMERLESLAEAWIDVAGLLVHRENDS
jgi:hypothetical protein